MNQRIELTRVVQFKGAFPDIQPDPRVDIAELTRGDAEPMFVTLPIAQIGNTAKTGHYYDEAFVHALADQVVSLDGLRGHPDIDPATGGASFNFFPSDVDWVGQMMEGDVLWGKFYVPPGPTQDYVRRVRAKAGKLSTSVLVDCKEERAADGRILMRNPQFRRVDLAPFYSAAAPVGDGSFAVTAQMVGEAVSDLPPADVEHAGANPNEDDMDRNEVIAQMTAADVTLIPQAVKDRIVAETATSQVAQISTLSAENEELKSMVGQMRTTLRDGVINDVVAQMVTLPETVTDEQRSDMDALLSTFRTSLVSQIGEEADSAAIKEKAQTLWDANYKRLAEALVRQMAGPNTFVPGDNNRNAGDEQRRQELLDYATKRAEGIVKGAKQEATNG